MWKDYFTLALKNLRHRGIRSWLTLLGIFIGVAAVVALIGLGNGLKTAVSAQFGISATELLTIQSAGLNYGLPGSGAANPLTTEDLKVVQKVNNVNMAARRNLGTVKLTTREDKIIFSTAASIPSGEQRDFVYESMDVETLHGFLLEDGDTNEIVVGYGYSVDKNDGTKPIKVGDRIDINGQSFKVKGVLKKTGSFIFDYIVLMNERQLEDILDFEDTVDIIAVELKNTDDMEKTKADIEKALRKQRNVKIGEEDFEVSTPESSMATVNSILTGIQIFVVIIAGISVFIGAVGIVNTMATSVIERKKEIGIMKSIGAKNSHIFYQFFVEAGLLGLVGGILGALIGTLVSVAGILTLNLQLGTELTPTIDFVLITLSLSSSFLIGAVAGIVPAMNAAKQNPVDALRG